MEILMVLDDSLYTMVFTSKNTMAHFQKKNPKKTCFFFFAKIKKKKKKKTCFVFAKMLSVTTTYLDTRQKASAHIAGHGPNLMTTC